MVYPYEENFMDKKNDKNKMNIFGFFIDLAKLFVVFRKNMSFAICFFAYWTDMLLFFFYRLMTLMTSMFFIH